MQLNYRITFKIVILLASLFIAVGLFFTLNAGNQASATVIPVDPCGSYTTTAPASPIIDGFTPCGVTINTTTANIGANFRDSGTSWPGGNGGIVLSTVTVKLDGTLVSGCTVSGSEPYALSYPAGTTTYRSGSVSCPVSGLFEGVHNFAVYAKGPYPWSSTGNASFTVETSPVCTVGKPNLILAAPVASWGSYANYVAGNLSITWTVNNVGTTTANNVTLTSSTSTNPAVTTLTSMPATVGTGTIAPSSSGSVTVQYHVPNYVGSFHVINTASATDCAANLYTYP